MLTSAGAAVPELVIVAREASRVAQKGKARFAAAPLVLVMSARTAKPPDCSYDAAQSQVRAKALRLGERRVSTAGIDLEVVERRTVHFREARAEQHEKAAALAGGAYDVARLKELAFQRVDLVERVRRRWVKYRDDSGRLRRRLDVRRVFEGEGRAAATRKRWHESRATGQRSRMSSVAHCGDGQIAATCSCCGQVQESHVWCACVRLCLRCSSKRANRARARFALAFSVHHERARRAGLLLKNRKGGAYSERHIVLTAPHVVIRGQTGAADRQATARRRIELMFEAWRDFSRAMQAWYRRRKEREAIIYRAFEWTPGADGMGHPHFHLWNFGPYLAEGLLRAWWSRALARVGVVVAPESVVITVRRIWARPVEFIREVRKPSGVVFQRKTTRVLLDVAGDDLLRYLEGWCVATIDPATRERCGDDVIAGVYCALEGRRLTQASAGFLGEADARLVTACDCGALAPRYVVVESWSRKVARTIEEGARAELGQCQLEPPVPAAVAPPMSGDDLELGELRAWHAMTGGVASYRRVGLRKDGPDLFVVDKEEQATARARWLLRRLRERDRF